MDTLRFGIVGLGRRALMGHIPTITHSTEPVEITALCSRHDEYLRRGAELCRSEPTWFHDLNDMLAHAHVDVVVICTPDFMHRDQAVACFEAGKHVYLEKPLALSAGDCDDILEAASRAGKVLQVSLVFRYANLFRRARQIIEHGDIGQVKMAWCHELVEFPNLFRGWHTDKANNGGILVTKTCHHFDILNWMVDQPAVSVYASASNEVMDPGSDVSDNAWCIIQYERARASLGLCLFARYGNDIELGVVGDQGTMVVRHDAHEIHVHPRIPFQPTDGAYPQGEMSPQFRCHPVDRSREFTGYGHQGDVRALTDLVGSIREAHQPAANGQVGRDCVLLGLAAERSVETGRVVTLAELTGAAP